jgi:hypothetical protein
MSVAVSKPRPPKRDEPMSSLQIFVLAMIAKARARTLYDFKAAGVSTGAVSGPIVSLLKKGLLSKAAGSGGRQTLAATRSGTQALEQHWRECLEGMPPDMGTALRSFWVACLMGEPEEASTYLRGVAWYRRVNFRAFGKVPHDEGPHVKDMLQGFEWLLAYWTSKMVWQEGEIVENIASIVKEEPVIAAIAKGATTKRKVERGTQTSKSKKEER